MRGSARKRCLAMPTSRFADDDDAGGLEPRAATPDHARRRRTAGSTSSARCAVLSDAERAAIVQCYHNDLSHEEAAFVLGMPGRHRQDARAARQAEAQGAARGLGPLSRAPTRMTTMRERTTRYPTTTGSSARCATRAASMRRPTFPTTASRRASCRRCPRRSPLPPGASPRRSDVDRGRGGRRNAHSPTRSLTSPTRRSG